MKRQTEGGPEIRLSGLPTVVMIQKAGGITQNANLRGVCCSADCRGADRFRYKQAKLDLLDLVLDGNQGQNPFFLMATDSNL